LAARTAGAVALSTRKGPGYVVPRLFAGKPTDLDTNRCYHAIPRKYSNNPILRLKVKLENIYLGSHDDKAVLAKTKEINDRRGRSPFQRFGTKNTSFVEAMVHYGAEYKPDIASISGRKVTFKDGSEFIADRIVFCTGYRALYPFLAECPHLAEGGSNPRLMFKRMIHPDAGADIVWIGLVRPGFGSIPPMAEMQARYFAQLVSGKLSLPPKEVMIEDIKRQEQLDMEQYPDDAGTIKPLTDYYRFMNAMAAEIGCAPSLSKLFLTSPRLWFKVLFAPLAGVQFRLNGPGADPVRARAVLARTPTMPWPVLAYEFAFLSASKGIDLLQSLVKGRDAGPKRFPANPAGTVKP
jgi:dimethylaniline monooxygenase (N-oxide forming)